MWCQDKSRLSVGDELCDSTYKLKQGRVAGHWNFNLEILVAYDKTFFGKRFRLTLKTNIFNFI
jgi:hypothetical protein